MKQIRSKNSEIYPRPGDYFLVFMVFTNRIGMSIIYAHKILLPRCSLPAAESGSEREMNMHHDETMHTHEHTHEDGHTHTHEHTHPHDHEHSHDHGCDEHACASCAGCAPADPKQELMALMKYMVGHNTAHANELAQLAKQLQDLGENTAYEQIMLAVSDFEKGNLRLSTVLTAMNG